LNQIAAMQKYYSTLWGEGQLRSRFPWGQQLWPDQSLTQNTHQTGTTFGVRPPGGEAGIVVEENAPPDEAPRFVAVYFAAEDLGKLIRHMQAMREEYEAQN